MRRAWLAVAVLIAVGCKPKPQPPATGDSVAVVDTMDSVGTDSILLDEPWTNDANGVEADVDTAALNKILAQPPSPARRAAYTSGLAYGISGVNSGDWCNWPLNGMMFQALPDNNGTLKVVQMAARCNMRVFLVPARRYITVCNDNHCPIDMAKAKNTTAKIMKQLPIDTVKKYERNILGYNLADDYGSLSQWGGVKVTQEQIAEWAAYTKQIAPWMPIGVRVEPWWIVKGSATAATILKAKLDYAWCQYHTKKGPASTYYDKCATDAGKYGLRIEMSVNIADCHGAADNTGPCTPTELKNFGGLAVNNPKTCADVSWKYDTDQGDETWTPTLKAVHMDLAQIAKARPTTNCRKGTVSSAIDSTSTGDSAVVTAAAAETTPARVPPGHRRK